MSIKKNVRVRSCQVATFSLLAAAALIGTARYAAAFAAAESAGTGETCAFSLQLQNSVVDRKKYLVKLDAARGGAYAKSNDVEKMYASVKKASFSADDSDDNEDASAYRYFSQKKQGSVVSIDAFSADCIGCHDGVGATAVGVDLRNRPYDRSSRVNSFSNDHPIGMDYSRYVGANRGYNNIMQGSNKMVFVNGRVGCLSCHDPLNQEKGHLVMSDQHSALCNTCHSK
jgi:hypothetical protein